MISSKPYLIRAIYEWIVDNNQTPYIAVDTSIDGVMVPKEYIENERIVLNISPTSTSNLIINKTALEFKARFNGIIHSVYIPVAAVVVIYSKENNQGMVFPADKYLKDDDSDSSTSVTKNNILCANLNRTKPQLRLVDGGKNKD